MLKIEKRSLHARWDNTRGMVAWIGRKGAVGKTCTLANLIANAAARGACHAR